MSQRHKLKEQLENKILTHYEERIFSDFGRPETQTSQ